MNPMFYKVVHLIGVIAMFVGIASALMPKDTPGRKIGLRIHGIGLVLLLVGGFGLIATLQIGFPAWVVAKLVLWFAFGAMPIIGKRGLMPAPTAWGIAIACGVVAVLLGVTHGNLGALFASAE